MEILKTATDWAKAEVFSTTFFILFGIGFVAASIGFWQLGKTDLAKLMNGELVYTGSLRTNIAAIVHSIPIRDGAVRVSSELFVCFHQNQCLSLPGSHCQSAP